MTATGQVRTFDFSDRDLYNPRYIPLFENSTEFLHMVGSAGSGKSRFAAQREIVESFDSKRANRNTLVSRKVGATMKDSVYAELLTVINEWQLTDCFKALKNPLEIHNLVTGVTFLFKGLDDVEKVKSIGGVDRVWIEEATELDTYSELQQLRLRLRGFRHVQITLSYNPINKFHWLNTDIHEMRPDGHFIFKTTYRDNVKMLAVSPGYADYIESLKESNPNYYKVYGLGEWGENPEGLIYSYSTDYTEMPRPDGYGVDFGWNDPCALAEVAIRDIPGKDKKTLFANGRLFKTKLTPTELVKEFDDLRIDKNIPMACDGSWPAYIHELKKAGYFAFAVDKGPGSIKAGITAVQEYELQIIAGNKEMLKEAGNYSWANKNGEWLDQPVDGADHYMDGIRYGVKATKYVPRPENLSPAEQRERTIPPALRFEAIEERTPNQPQEQTERELAAHDNWARIAEIVKKQKEESENADGYFSL